MSHTRPVLAALIGGALLLAPGSATAQAAGAPPARPTALAVATDTTRGVPVIMREEFDYDAEGRRDPFFSLMSTEQLRPTLSDLRLTGITYSTTGRSVATLRDVVANKRYTAQVGTLLGRMRIVSIQPRAVIFSIEEFGTNRRDSLVLTDTTRRRTP